MGNPDQPTPRHIVEKLVESVQRTDTHGYSVSKGILRLRKAIANGVPMALLAGRADRVVVGLDMGNAAKTIPVAGVFADGTELLDAYSGARGTVANGRISLTSAYGLVLLGEQR